MTIHTHAQIMDILQMDFAAFSREIMPLAFEGMKGSKQGITASTMLGYSNICKNQCLYCGMRAGNSGLSRYRLSPNDICASLEQAQQSGHKRVFLVSGEDPGFPFADLLQVVAHGAKLGLQVSLAAGELAKAQYEELFAAGAREYVLKFEMADEATFNRLNPSTSYKQRMDCILQIKELGYALASGNIIDYPGQSLSMLADDILLCKQLGISWAPVIPYMPAKGTPLAQEGGFGSLELLYKEIALLRLMMPQIDITAQQPGQDKALGLTGLEGNLSAVRAGANILFVDLLPDAMVRNFSVVDNRFALDLAHASHVAKEAGLPLLR